MYIYACGFVFCFLFCLFVFLMVPKCSICGFDLRKKRMYIGLNIAQMPEKRKKKKKKEKKRKEKKISYIDNWKIKLQVTQVKKFKLN